MTVYAKFINRHRVLPFTADKLSVGGRVYVNPTPAQLKDAGYLPLVYTSPDAQREGNQKIYMTDGTRIFVSATEKEEKK